LLGAVTLLAACAPAAAPAARPGALPQHPGYVLSGYNVGGGFRGNAVTIFDAASWRVDRRIPLPRSWAKSLARDPLGRLWIGFSGDLHESDDRVQVYSPQGALITTLRPCMDPDAGISFAAGRAFIACAETGLSGKVAVVDLGTLTIERTIELRLPGAPLLLIASAASEGAVVVAGATAGPKETGYSVATVIDPHSLAVHAQLALGEDTDVWRILPHRGRFYLLNVGSWRRPREQANDVLVLDPGAPPTVSPLAAAAAPLWGAIDGDILYAYHNPTWNQPNGDPRRRLSRLDLATGQVQVWPLEDGWNAADLAVIAGEVILVRWEGRGGAGDGLYRVDAGGRKPAQLLHVADASAVLAAPGAGRG
jgi:hypothetical protein